MTEVVKEWLEVSRELIEAAESDDVVRASRAVLRRQDLVEPCVAACEGLPDWVLQRLRHTEKQARDALDALKDRVDNDRKSVDGAGDGPPPGTVDMLV